MIDYNSWGSKQRAIDECNKQNLEFCEPCDAEEFAPGVWKYTGAFYSCKQGILAEDCNNVPPLPPAIAPYGHNWSQTGDCTDQECRDKVKS